MIRTVNSWARKNFGSVAGAVIALMTSVSLILQHALPIVRKLESLKGSWKNEDGTEHDYLLIRNLVEEAGGENPVAAADAVYVHKNRNLTLFNTAVFLLRMKSPLAPTPILNVTVEIAYNIMLMRAVREQN
jgi:hypothetical protein